MQYCYTLKILGDASGACSPEVGKLRIGECCFHLIQLWNRDLYHDLMVAHAYLRIVTKATERDRKVYGEGALARDKQRRRKGDANHG